MPTLDVVLPRPHEAQRQIKREARRFNVVACGRRFGKTTEGIDLLLEPALRGKPVAWFSPTYKMLAEVWRELKSVTVGITLRRSEQEHRLELITGGRIDMWSLDEPDTARGRAYARVVVDEAAMVKNLSDAWHQVIRPTLTDHTGDAWFLSTPRGLNAFYTLYQRGQDPGENEWRSWRFPSVANPHIPAAEVEAARHDLPSLMYAQEYEAEFVADGAGVFRAVAKAATATPQAQATPGHQYIIGVDWGKLNDYSVYAVFDLNERALVRLDRLNEIDYPRQLARLLSLCKLFKPTLVIAEKNSIGEPLTDFVRQAGVPLWPFQTTQGTKQAAIEALQLAFEQSHLRIIPDPILIGELQAYEAERLPSGMMRYGAPDGMHDDTVMALAMAWQGALVPRPAKPRSYTVKGANASAAIPPAARHLMQLGQGGR